MRIRVVRSWRQPSGKVDCKAGKTAKVLPAVRQRNILLYSPFPWTNETARLHQRPGTNWNVRRRRLRRLRPLRLWWERRELATQRPDRMTTSTTSTTTTMTTTMKGEIKQPLLLLLLLLLLMLWAVTTTTTTTTASILDAWLCHLYTVYTTVSLYFPQHNFASIFGLHYIHLQLLTMQFSTHASPYISLLHICLSITDLLNYKLIISN